MVQVEVVQRVVDPAFGDPRWDVVEVREEVQVGSGGHLLVEGRLLGQEAEPPAHLRLAGVVAGDRGRPGGGFEQSRQHLQRRRLAGAVGADDADDLASLDGEGDVVHRDEAAVLLAQSPRLDHCQAVSTDRTYTLAPD